MDWPDQAVEQIPGREFEPPHCPRAECPAHIDASRFRYHRHSVYKRRAEPRTVHRFRCLCCKRTFSQLAFSCIYYLKRPELLIPIAAGLVAGSAHRQIARSNGCAPSTVTRIFVRFGRHTGLLNALAGKEIGSPQEAIVFDHFETFSSSQDFPIGVGTAVGQQSSYMYAHEPALHRRGGRMTKAQKSRQKSVSLPKGAYARSTAEVLVEVMGEERVSFTLITDGHPAYRWTLERDPRFRKILHLAYPNPKRGPKGSPRSPEARLRDSMMFPVDTTHKLARHTLAHCRRETIAFPRRANALMERFNVFAAWRNFVKRRTERKSDAPTPAMVLGLTDRPWSWQRVFGQRLFAKRVDPGPRVMKVYRRQWIHPGEGFTHPYRRVHAA